MTRPTIIAANWKMNGTRESNQRLVEGIKSGLGESGLDQGRAKVMIAAPFVYLEQLSQLVSGTGIKVGAQNVSEFEKGAYTGEVSGEMLSDLSCDFCLVGHSERRALFGESDSLVAKKVERLLSCGVLPLLCVGETLEQREKGETEQVVERQLSAVAELIGSDGLEKTILAYEPVWAIGTGKTASPEQAQAVHKHLRQCLSSYGSKLAEKVPILYGGSVNENNASDLFEQEDIDGGLIGGASLKADGFLKICKVTESG